MSAYQQYKQAVASSNVKNALACFAPTAPTVVCVPTAAGADGSQASLAHFVSTLIAQREHMNNEERILSTVVSSDRLQIVEESILSMVHDAPIDWFLPQVKPTRKRVVFPLVTIVHLDPATTKMQTMHMYWDQASVLRQIGVLPNSLYCKANASETVLPVQGPRIVDRLQEPYNNLAVSAENVAYADNYEEPNSVVASRKASSFDIFNQPPTTAAEQHQADSRANPAHTEMSGIMGMAEPVTGSKPSSRVIHRPGGPVSDIFGNDNTYQPARTGVAINPQRYQSNVVFGHDEAPLPATTAAAAARSRNESASSVNNEYASNGAGDPVTGSKPSSRVIHRPGGPVSDIFGTEASRSAPQQQQQPAVAAPAEAPYSRPNTGRRDPNWSSLSYNNNGFDDTPLPTQTGRKHSSFGLSGAESQIEFGIAAPQQHRTGRGGYHNPNETQYEAADRKAAAATHAANVAAAGAVSGMVGTAGPGGRYDRNAPSVEAASKPSSKVLAPPGGKTSVFFG
ncbi:hypothetical protein HDU77_004739 [Chytriomyces hyalinus]|nr:hypothetical protein HDU77_004739 [Chytriomyces hyalinus]